MGVGMAYFSGQAVGRGREAMSAALPTVLVVIVNYRTARLVVECLRSLAPEIAAHGGARVVVVDNDSGDDSVAVLREAIVASGWSAWAEVLASDYNGGFAYGNNFVMRRALAGNTPPDCFWLLNPDTVVHRGALVTLAEYLRDNSHVGICGTAIEEGDGTPWPFAFRFPSIASEIESGFAFGPITRLLSRWRVAQKMGGEPTRVDWISGCSMGIRRQVVETIGLMDEGYFLYFEETDYCLQAKRKGIQCWYLPQSTIMHIAGQSTGVTARVDRPRRVPDYWFDSRRRFFVKNHGRLYAIGGDLAWIGSHLLGRFRKWLQRVPSTMPPCFLADFWRHSALWGRNLAGDARRSPDAERT